MSFLSTLGERSQRCSDGTEARAGSHRDPPPRPEGSHKVIFRPCMTGQGLVVGLLNFLKIWLDQNQTIKSITECCVSHHNWYASKGTTALVFTLTSQGGTESDPGLVTWSAPFPPNSNSDLILTSSPNSPTLLMPGSPAAPQTHCAQCHGAGWGPSWQILLAPSLEVPSFLRNPKCCLL